MAISKSVKEKILSEIDSLSDSEQETVLGVIENFIHGKVDESEWRQIPDSWKKRIMESISEAEEGKLVLHEDAVAYIRKKYGLNG